MGQERTEHPGPQGQDVVWEHVGVPPIFASSSNGPIEFLAVANDDHVLGYVWWSDAPPAASFAIRLAAGGIAKNAGVEWRKALLAAGREGLTPSAAVARLSSSVGLGVHGHVVADSMKRAESSAALKSSAAAEPATGIMGRD